MPIVSIRHRTTYRYRNPVAFGEHRIMFRPQESYDQRVLSAELAITPEPALLRNVHDVFGNCVSIARFSRRSDILQFEARMRLEHNPQAPFGGLDSDLYRPGCALYDQEDLPDLARSIALRHPDPAGEVAAWARRFVQPVGATRLQTLLAEMTHAIRAEFAYALRPQGAPQTPLETLARRSGSCRDFAVLMMEAVRTLGLAARFASGYVYNASQKGGPGRTGGGHTHAWVRVYLPSCGWVEFDPTNGIVGNTDLVRVAIACDPRQAIPLHGAWTGLVDDALGMEVEVDIAVEDEILTQPQRRLRVAESR